MARKIKFALEMADGTKVRGDLAELREHFDLESAVRYFLSGKLVEWLDDRYYEDEADALEQIDKDAPDFHQKLCKALGVEYEAEDDLDVAVLERLNEKRSILRQRTDDEEIIKNADKTALTQEDLADLLDLGEDVIYLCGKEFTVPARVKNKKYIGILGTPKVMIKAISEAELTDKGILFENVVLPWSETPLNERAHSPEVKAESASKLSAIDTKKIKEIFWTSYPNYKDTAFPIWEIVTPNAGKKKKIELNNIQKEIALNTICHGKYSEQEILFIKVTSNFKAGWAFTKDSFCYGGTIGNGVIPYSDILGVRTYLGATNSNGLWINENGTEHRIWDENYGSDSCNGVIYGNANENQMKRIANVLDTIRNLYPSKRNPSTAYAPSGMGRLLGNSLPVKSLSSLFG